MKSEPIIYNATTLLRILSVAEGQTYARVAHIANFTYSHCRALLICLQQDGFLTTTKTGRRYSIKFTPRGNELLMNLLQQKELYPELYRERSYGTY